MTGQLTARQELFELGIRSHPATVVEVAVRLRSGATPYSIYKPEGRVPLAAKGTVRKIARLLAQGDLDFLLAEDRPSEIIRKVYPMIGETDAQRLVRDAKDSITYRQEQAEWAATPESDRAVDGRVDVRGRKRPSSIWQAGSAFSPTLADHVRQRAIKALPETDWSVAGLEKAGVPADKVLAMLTEYDELHRRRREAEVPVYNEEDEKEYEESQERRIAKARDMPMDPAARNDYVQEIIASRVSYRDALAESWYLPHFLGLERYMALHYIVDFYRHIPSGGPFNIVSYAAELRVKGTLSSTVFSRGHRLQAAGEDLVRYQVWRGPGYLEAFFKAQERFLSTKKRREKFRAEIRSAIDSINGKPSEAESAGAQRKQKEA